MRYTLLQKSSGDFYLALWNNVSVYQTATAQTAGEDLYPAGVAVTIRFSTPQDFAVYAPNDDSGMNPTETYTLSMTPTSITINLSPEVLLIRIVNQ